MLTIVFILMGLAVCASCTLGIYFYAKSKKYLTEIFDLKDQIEILKEHYKQEGRISCELRSRLLEYTRALHVIEADAPVKKSAMYASMKLSGELKNFITYNEANDKCRIMVMKFKDIKKDDE